MEKADAEEDVSSELDNTKSVGDCSATATPFLLTLLSSFEGTILHSPSDDSGEDTPVPIPNTEVKLSSADGSWG